MPRKADTAEAATEATKATEPQAGDDRPDGAFAADTIIEHAEEVASKDMEQDIIRKMPAEIRRKMIKVQGGRSYLQVQDRLIWFRKDHPAESGWGIRSSPIEVDYKAQYAVFHATITDPEGRIIGEGVKSESVKGFGDYIEKAATGAIGRALAVIGYGTQFTGDEFREGERIVDAPVQSRGGASEASNAQDRMVEGGIVCAVCRSALTKGQHDFSMARFGKPLCPKHQNEAKAGVASNPSDAYWLGIVDICKRMGWDVAHCVNTISEGRTEDYQELTPATRAKMLAWLKDEARKVSEGATR